MFFCWHWDGSVFSWCCLSSVCYIRRNHLFGSRTLSWHELRKEGSFCFGCLALGLARGWGFCWGGATAASLWNVLILSPTRRPAPKVPFLSPSYTPSFCFLSQSPLPNRGSGPLYIWVKKSDSWKKLRAVFSLCAGMHVGNWEGNLFLPRLNFIILWTNSSKGLGKWEGGQRRQQGNNRYVLFDF